MDILVTPDVDLDEMTALYDAVDWSAYTQHPEHFGSMIENAWLVVVARDDAGNLAGLARVVGDGATVALVQDLLVHPQHQRQGLGSRLLDVVLERAAGIRQVYLTTDAAVENAHVVRLYEAKGFRPVGDMGCTTLARFSF